MFNENEEQKSQFLVQVRSWDKAECINFLSYIRDRYNLAPNMNLSSDQVLTNLDLSTLKSQVVRLVQSCDSVDQLQGYSNPGWN